MIDPTSLIITYGLVGLLIITIISTSIIPFPYEPAAVLSLKFFNPIIVFITIILGALGGGLINYFIGYRGVRSFIAKRSPEKEKKARKWFNKWGPYVLFAAPWTPFFGDPMTIVAGTLKMPKRKYFMFLGGGIILKAAFVVYLGEMVLGYLVSIGVI